MSDNEPHQTRPPVLSKEEYEAYDPKRNGYFLYEIGGEAFLVRYVNGCRDREPVTYDELAYRAEMKQTASLEQRAKEERRAGAAPLTDEIAGAARALGTRAALQRQKAADGISDLKLAYDLFEGVMALDNKTRKGKKLKQQLPKQCFLQDDEEKEALAALGRLLRSDLPLDRHLRDLLATHFDGCSVTYFTKGPAGQKAHDWKARRRLRFIAPRGATKDGQRLFKIGAEVFAHIDAERVANRSCSVEAAVSAVAKRYGLGNDHVWDGWNELKKRGWGLNRRI